MTRACCRGSCRWARRWWRWCWRTTCCAGGRSAGGDGSGIALHTLRHLEVRSTCAGILLLARLRRRVPLEVGVVPGDRLLLRPPARLQVDAVVRDVRDHHQLLRPLGPLVGLDAVLLVVEQLLLLRQEEQHRAAGRLV